MQVGKKMANERVARILYQVLQGARQFTGSGDTSQWTSYLFAGGQLAIT
jgi:hypothetical protein